MIVLSAVAILIENAVVACALSALVLLLALFVHLRHKVLLNIRIPCC